MSGTVPADQVRCFPNSVRSIRSTTRHRLGTWEPVSLAASGVGEGGIAIAGQRYGFMVRGLENWTGTRWIEIETNDPVNPVKKVAILEL